ncbi:MAG: hypothetical protein CSA62_10160 [Planctomycetota bacterium]|nr:MAG: hypothetical protein CSA62_10160 [Planctomycetota bacterium]
MKKHSKKGAVRRWCLILHRDLGYFFAGAVILYAVSGLAVNHINDWNPDFIVEHQERPFSLPSEQAAIDHDVVRAALKQHGINNKYRSYDFPTEHKIKIYLEDASLFMRLGEKTAAYESVHRRPFFFESNRLHLDPKGWWLVFSDIFALCLIFLAVSGLVILRGKNGFFGRGKWFVAAGLIVPLLFLFTV